MAMFIYGGIILSNPIKNLAKKTKTPVIIENDLDNFLLTKKLSGVFVTGKNQN
jgi:hypothetical protein